jgi:hypothetical protein
MIRFRRFRFRLRFCNTDSKTTCLYRRGIKDRRAFCMLIRIREVNFVWIHADPGLDPKHCPWRVLLSALASRLVFAPFFILFSLEFIAFTGKR